MRNSEILTLALYLTIGLALLAGVITFLILMAVEGIAHHAARRRQPRQQANGRYPANSGHIPPAASQSNKALLPMSGDLPAGRSPQPTGVPPAGPLTHNFRYEQCSIPAGITLTQWRHGAGR